MIDPNIVKPLMRIKINEAYILLDFIDNNQNWIILSIR